MGKKLLLKKKLLKNGKTNTSYAITTIHLISLILKKTGCIVFNMVNRIPAVFSQLIKQFTTGMCGSLHWNIFFLFKCAICVSIKNTGYGTVHVTWTMH